MKEKLRRKGARTLAAGDLPRAVHQRQAHRAWLTPTQASKEAGAGPGGSGADRASRHTRRNKMERNWIPCTTLPELAHQWHHCQTAGHTCVGLTLLKSFAAEPLLCVGYLQ